jgi:ribonuclease T2
VIARIFVAATLILSAGCSDGGEQQVATIPTPIVNAAPSAQKAPMQASIPQGSGFDFYVLSLSWSPHYCASKNGSGDPQQCESAKPFGFIVHGLWPQFERGYPENCAVRAEPTREDIGSVTDLTPSPGLIRYEWKKHGTCSGLTPPDYFKVMRRARDIINIPPQLNSVPRAIALSANQIENAFVQSNPRLTAQAIAVDCDRQKLAEVRICLTKSLEFRTCPEVDRAGCRAQSISIEPIK